MDALRNRLHDIELRSDPKNETLMDVLSHRLHDLELRSDPKNETLSIRLVNHRFARVTSVALGVIADEEVALRLKAGRKVGNALCKVSPHMVISDGPVIVHRDTFQGCSSLLSITLPSSVMSVDIGCFIDCPYAEITVPAHLADAFFGKV